jgi:hypothetical protein
MLEVKVTKKMGRGLFAKLNIKANTKVHEAYFIRTKDEELNLCPDLAKYAFKYSNKYSVICLGVGSLFNHSENPSVEAYFNKNKNGEIMEFWSTRDIKSGEEVFISYGGEEYAFAHLLKKEKKKFDMYDYIENFKTKYPEGFTSEELERMLKKFPKLNRQKFNDSMFCNTCLLIDNKIVNYVHDVILAVKLGTEK